MADAVVAVTGIDPWPEIRGAYGSAEEAHALMQARGFADMGEVLADKFPPVGRLLAQRGDVGVIENDGELAAGYVCEHGFAVKTKRGLAFRPVTAIVQAFKVG